VRGSDASPHVDAVEVEVLEDPLGVAFGIRPPVWRYRESSALEPGCRRRKIRAALDERLDAEVLLHTPRSAGAGNGGAESVGTENVPSSEVTKSVRQSLPLPAG
jgi:hypothetical protein